MSTKFAFHLSLTTIAGIILICSSGLKAYQMAYYGVTLEGFLPSKWLMRPTILVEFLLGLWMVSGVYPRTTQVLGAICFLFLGEIAVWQVLQGKESCGCLGVIRISPWIAVAVDTVMLTGFVVAIVLGSKSMYVHNGGKRTRLCFFAIAAVAICVPGLLLMTTYQRDVKRFSDLRHDQALNKKITVATNQPSLPELMRLVEKECGMTLRVHSEFESAFSERTFDASKFAHSSVRSWAVLESISKASPIPSRWVKTRDGYMLIPDNPFSRTKYIWLFSLILGCGAFLSAYIYIRRMTSAHPGEKSAAMVSAAM